MNDFEACQEVFRRFFKNGFPARTTTTTDFVFPNILVHIDAVAYKKAEVKSEGRSGQMEFRITPEQKERVVFTPGKIGVNEFSRCVNLFIDLNISKKLTGIELNKKLKKFGILSEEDTEDGRKRTVINANSAKYGIESEKRTYNGVEYDAVVINDNGKKYILDNIEAIMKAG